MSFSWAFAWRVNAPLETFSFFTAGGFAGERLATWGNDKLECYIADKSPSHTALLFAYYEYMATEAEEILTTEDGEDLCLTL